MNQCQMTVDVGELLTTEYGRNGVAARSGRWTSLKVGACFLGVLAFGSGAWGSTAIPNKSVSVDDVFRAVVMVETRGKAEAIGKAGELGPAQVTRAVLADVKTFCGKEFSPSECFSLVKSGEIFRLYTEVWIRRNHYDDTPRNRAAIWHGGPRGPERPEIRAYADRVCALLGIAG